MEKNKTFFRQKNKASPSLQTLLYRMITIYCLILMTIGVIAEPSLNLWHGMVNIITAPSNLITDYFEVGNFGSAFFNSGMLTLISLLLSWYKKVEISGPMLAGFFTVSGFSFFGKNIFNSIPIFLGVILYSYMVKKPYSQFLLVALYGSALSPVISYIAFGTGLPLPLGIALGYLIGVIIGILLPPLSSQFLQFHQGFSLYNIGFTSGILAMMIASIMRLFGEEIETAHFVAPQYSTLVAAFLIFLSLFLLIIGFILNKYSFKGMKAIIKSSGNLVTDFVSISGIGATMINMGIMGFILIGFVYLLGGTFSGPILGAILTVIGFSAFGNHFKNSVPILIGVVFASFISPMYTDDTFSILLTAIFGTSLAPIAGYYGTIPGILAGFLHITLVTNVTYLHGGLNLYNNGFSSGFVAACMVPILDMINEKKESFRNDRKRKSASDS